MSILNYLIESKTKQITAYHGTNQDFDIFTKDVKGITKKGYTSAHGFWFTDSQEEAVQYAKYSDKMNVANSDAHEKKMDDYSTQIAKAERVRNYDLAEKLTGEMEDFDLNNDDEYAVIYTVNLLLNNPMVVDGASKDFDQANAIHNAVDRGHDSVIFTDITDSPYGLNNSTTQYVVFNHKNINIIDKEILS